MLIYHSVQLFLTVKHTETDMLLQDGCVTVRHLCARPFVTCVHVAPVVLLCCPLSLAAIIFITAMTFARNPEIGLLDFTAHSWKVERVTGLSPKMAATPFCASWCTEVSAQGGLDPPPCCHHRALALAQVCSTAFRDCCWPIRRYSGIQAESRALFV